MTWLLISSALGLFVAPLLVYFFWGLATAHTTSWWDVAGGILFLWLSSIVFLILRLLSDYFGPENEVRALRRGALQEGALSKRRVFWHGLVHGLAAGLVAVGFQMAVWVVWPTQIMLWTGIENEQVLGGIVMGMMIVIWMTGFGIMASRFDHVVKQSVASASRGLETFERTNTAEKRP